MTDEDRGYWGLKAWLWSLIKNHCALGKICHCTQPLPVCSCGSFPWRDESAVRYQLNYYCIFFGSASSASHPECAGMVSTLSESLWYRTQQGSDSITLSKQTANMSPACYHFSPIVMSEPLKAPLQNDEGAPLTSYAGDADSCSPLWNWGKEDEFIHICSSGVILRVPERTPITSLRSRGAKLLSGSNKAHAAREEDPIWKNQWQTLSC